MDQHAHPTLDASQGGDRAAACVWVPGRAGRPVSSHNLTLLEPSLSYSPGTVCAQTIISWPL